MALIKLSAVERRKLSIFFTCLILAVTAWLFFSLSNNYEYEVKTVVNFKNPPANKAFNPLQSDTVLLTVQGTGWQLLFSRLRIYPKNVQVDLKPLEKRNFITFSNQIRAINNLYSSEQKIIGVQPDTLYFDFTTRKVKKVPIKLITKLSFVKQFGQSSETSLKPNYVTVTGPQSSLNKINYWQTDTLNKSFINGSITTKISIKQADEANISIFPSSVEVKIPVEEFTEKRLNIPIKVIHNNEYYNIRLIPEKVKVIFMVSLSDYSNVNEDDFEAIVDLNLWKNNQISQLPILIKKRKAFTRIRRIIPNQIDFMIKK